MADLLPPEPWQVFEPDEENGYAWHLADVNGVPFLRLVGKLDQARKRRLLHLLRSANRMKPAAEKALGFVKYALEFFDWKAFPSLEAEVIELRDMLATALSLTKVEL